MKTPNEIIRQHARATAGRTLLSRASSDRCVRRLTARRWLLEARMHGQMPPTPVEREAQARHLAQLKALFPDLF